MCLPGSINSYLYVLIIHLFTGFLQIPNGFDLPTSQLILQKLAEFHAISIAMKEWKPREFAKHIKDKCVHLPKPTIKSQISKHMSDAFWEKLYENNGCLPYINKLKSGINKVSDIVEVKEPFGAMIHNDLWTKNVFVKFSEKNPIDICLIDFKEIAYNSPVVDVLFFLLTSLEYSILENHFFELIRYYYSSLIQNINLYQKDEAQIDIQHFEVQKFYEEVKRTGMAVLIKTVFFMLDTVFGGKTLDTLSADDKKRIWLMIQQMGSNDWL